MNKNRKIQENAFLTLLTDYVVRMVWVADPKEVPELSILMQIACVESDIVPPSLENAMQPHYGRIPDNNVDEFHASMSEEDARASKRKFRKLWRARVRRYCVCYPHFDFKDSTKKLNSTYTQNPSYVRSVDTLQCVLESFIRSVVKHKSNEKTNGLPSPYYAKMMAYSEALQRYMESNPDVLQKIKSDYTVS